MSSLHVYEKEDTSLPFLPFPPPPVLKEGIITACSVFCSSGDDSEGGGGQDKRGKKRSDLDELRRCVDDFFDYAHRSGVMAKFEKETTTNPRWLVEVWEEMAYLSVRAPLQLASNFYQVAMTAEEVGVSGTQIEVVAKLAEACGRVKDELESGAFKREKWGSMPINMWQYDRSFKTCRIPQRGVDRLRLTTPNESDHFVVIASGGRQIFSIPFSSSLPHISCDRHAQKSEIQKGGKKGEKDGHRLCWHDIARLIELGMRDTPMLDAPLTTLAGLNRDEWAKYRDELSKREDGRELLEKLETAAVIFGLASTDDINGSDRSKVTSLSYSHGGHLCYYDKPFNILVMPNGGYTTSGDHTPADGTVGVFVQDRVVEVAREIQHASITSPTPSAYGSSPPSPSLSHLLTPCYARLSEEERERCETAKAENIKNGRKIEVEVIVEEEEAFDLDMMKRLSVSRDTLMQIAIQLAYNKCSNTIAAVYESAATRMFRFGRTETIHACQPSVADFARMCGQAVPSLVVAAEKLQRALVDLRQHQKDCTIGKGFDRALLWLRLEVGKERGSDHPLFSLPAFVQATTYKVSTSQVQSRYIAGGGFTPTESDGYGVCYSFKTGGRYVANIVSGPLAPTSALTFAAHLRSALTALRYMLVFELERRHSTVRSKL